MLGLTYTQKYEVEGLGTYEVKIMTLINFKSFRWTLSSASLINPIYMMAVLQKKNKPQEIEKYSKISEGAKLRMIDCRIPRKSKQLVLQYKESNPLKDPRQRF